MSLARWSGNPAAWDRLRKMAAGGRIPPSLLLSGPEGSGKLRAAMAFAKALNCLEAGQHPGDACNRCPPCRRAEQGAHPDIRRIGPEGPGGQVKAEVIRRVVMESPFRPFEGRRRVYIIEQADRMNPTAANTFLKTLEEPPPWTVLILLTANEAALLPTLRSRCQKIRFLPLRPEDVIDCLVEEHGIPRDRARLAAGVAGGNLSRALRLADEVEALHGQAQEIALIPTRRQRYSELLARAGRLAKAAQPALILRLAACQLRDLASAACGGEALHTELTPRLQEQAARLPIQVWIEGYLRVEEAIHDLEVRYANKRITLEQTLLRLNHLGSGQSVPRRTALPKRRMGP